MFKRILSIVLSLLIFASSLPALAASNDADIALSETFENYAENAKSVGDSIKLQTGVDSRVISESGGNKALYLKAWGQGAKVKANFTLPKDSKDLVFSAKVKVTGEKVGAKLFSVAGGGSATFLSSTADNRLALPDGMPLSGLRYGEWTEYTIMVDLASKLYDVYINGKCVTKNLYLTTNLTSSVNEITWSINEPEEGSSELLLDDIRIYTGTKLPSDMQFPKVKRSNEILDFVPTPEVKQELRLITNLTFDESAKDAAMALNGGTMEHKLLEDGNGVIHFFADEDTNSKSYMDIQCPELATFNKYVVSCDVWVNKLTGSSCFIVFDGRGPDLAWNLGAELTASGILRSRQTTVANKPTIGSYTAGTNPVNIAFAYNISAGTFDVYINGELHTKDALCMDIAAASFRFEVYNSKGNTLDCYLDNIKAYNAEAPLSDEELTSLLNPEADASGREASQMNVDEAVESYLSGCSVFMLTTDWMFADGKKQKYPDDNTKPFVQNGTFMISAPMIESITGYSVTCDEASGIVKVGSSIEAKLGETSFTSGSKGYTFPEAPLLKDGVVFLPFKALMADGLKKSVSYDERGMIILSDSPFTHTDDDYILEEFETIDHIWRYMQFDNPLGTQMLADLEERIGNQHPRVLLTGEQINYILDRVATGDPQWTGAYQRAIQVADETLKTAPISASPTDSLKQAAAANYNNKMRDTAIAYMLTGDDKYARYAIENLSAAISWDSLGESVAQLTSGDWAYGTAIGMDSFYYYLQRTADGRAIYQKAKETIKNLPFANLIGTYRGTGGNYRWIKMVDNFNPLIGGGMMCLILSVASEEDMKEDCAYLLENVYKSMQIPVGIFGPDGAWYEGVSYGAYGLGLMSYGLVALKNCCGSLYGLDTAKGFAEIPNWYMYLGTPNADFNFHDMKPKHEETNRPYAISWLCDDALTMEAFHRHKSMTDEPIDVLSLMYYELTTTGTDAKAQLAYMPLDHYFRKAEAGGFLSSLDTKNPTFAGFHGGWTGLYHDSLDLGEFFFEADGIVWAYDIGSDKYTMPSYFAIPDGYMHYRKNPQGENVVVINPKTDATKYHGQEVGVFAPLTDFATAPRGAKAAYDLTPAYERDVNSYTRGYLFGDNRNTLTVRDEINLKDTSELYWFMHTPASIKIVDNNTAILTKDGKQCRVEVACSNASYELKAMEAKLLPDSPGVEHEALGESNADIQKLAIHFTSAPAGELDITVKLLPQTKRYDYTPVDGNTSIADWTLPEGQLEKLLTLSSLSADGVSVEGFLPDLYDYTLTLPFGSTQAPVITAQAAEGSVHITQAQSVDDSAIVTVSAYGRRTVTYTVKFVVSSNREVIITENLRDVKPQVGVPGQLINPISADGSSIPEPKNGPSNMIDGDFSTRYAIADICWFEIDLGEVTDIGGVALSFMDGSKRLQYYDVLYSEDGIHYTKVFSGESTGETEEYESLSIPGRARYLRMIGYGNSTSTYNSVTEFRAFK